MTEVVEHKMEELMFVIERDGSVAHLDYQVVNDGIHFISTYVPFALRGKGLAEQLVETGLRWADNQELKITTSCWYVEKFLP